MDDEAGTFSSDPRLTFQHPSPPTKVMFIPDKDCTRPDLLATAGDFLRIWHLSEDGVQLQKLLNNVRRARSSLPPTCSTPDKAAGVWRWPPPALT